MKTAKQFYTELTPEKLAKRKKEEFTKKELAYLKKMLNKKQKILDLACGYGRFTIPLAKQGYYIEGIDITPSLIKKARNDAKKQKLKIKFRVGDMRKLPYKDRNFDAIICMWSAFNELSNKKDQLEAVKEMQRVLTKGGFALLEMPIPLKDKVKKVIYKKIGDEFHFHKKTGITTGKIASITINPHFKQTNKTLSKLMKTIRIKKYKIFRDKFGGRNRFFLKFHK